MMTHNRQSLFARIKYWPYMAWDDGSRAELLLAVATIMLGIRSFEMFGSHPRFPAPTACYPWDWILSSLDKPYAAELLNRAANWPPRLRFPVLIAAGVTKRSISLGNYSAN